MSEIPWSLHLLSEVLSAFSVEDPKALITVINRVAEAVDAEVVAIVGADGVRHAIGFRDDQFHLLLDGEAIPATIPLQGGSLHTYWAPLGQGERLVVGRLSHGFDLEERSLLRAMARSVELSSEVLRAVTAERRAKEDALHQATHDALTGLPGRALVLQGLDQLLQSGRIPGGETATVLFIDIDRFKQINDVHGHASGDQFLRSVATALRSVVRSADLVGRLSGDEFVVVTCTHRYEDAETLAQRIIEQVGRPQMLAGKLVSYSPSVGIAVGEPHDTAESLIENADMAMYKAKEQGRGCHASYDASMRELARGRAATETELRRAVRQGQIVAHFQPIVSTDGRRVVGFEALARWCHPSHGLLPPSAFVAVAEDTGLIIDIDRLILESTCATLGRWKQQFPHLQLRLSVNVSARSFMDPLLSERVARALSSAGLQPKDLYLEITETMLVEDIEATTLVVDQLKQLGVRLAIDDFGTGYSSMIYLKRFPVGILKIDRSFIDGLGQDLEDEVIVKAVIGLATALGIDLVAEGVETEMQAQMLQELGCNFMQGYCFGRPMAVDQAERMLTAVAEMQSPAQLA
jgi:diguanylate cyclase (GGDEF)-like protein